MLAHIVRRAYELPLTTVLLAAITVGCTDRNPPTAPDDAETTAAAASAVARGDRYIVLLRGEGVSRLQANTLGTEVARLGGRIERAHNEIGVLEVRNLTAAGAARLAGQAGVEAVVKDRTIQLVAPGERRTADLRRVEPRPESNQSGAAFFADQWNLRQIKAHRAWDVSRQGQDVTVCIMDSGVDPRHIDVEGKLDLEISASFVAQERADRDFVSHGTGMASIMSSNGIGIASVAPDARVCSVKIFDRNGTTTNGDVIAAMMYVGTIGADVVNMSFGALLPANDPDVRALLRAEQRAINFATRRGVLFVASAGNQAADLNDPNLIHDPSGLDNVISVGATGPINQRRFDRVASYSNFGREGVDVFAPGGDFVPPQGVLEDLVLEACSASLREGGTLPCADGNVYFFSAGTSQAAAHVSGLAAVIESELPGDQSPAELTACILQNADELARPQITANGRINVLRAQDCGAPGNLVAGR
jgi:lantibiotic leader peptide-processing serine protease